jgi:hypothetical protein
LNALDLFGSVVVAMLPNYCRIEEFMQGLMGGPLGDAGANDLAGFSFADTASNLASDLMNSLVIDVAVDLEFAFGLDLNPLFNNRTWPKPLFHINRFDVDGVLGVNEWSTELTLGDFTVAITEAKVCFLHPVFLDTPHLSPKINILSYLSEIMHI